jgi:hypothetical protein
MSSAAGRKALGVSSAELKATITEAERDHAAAAVALGEALVVQRAMPDRDVAPEQAAVDAARRRVEQLRVMLPIVERAETEALEATRATVDADRRKQLARVLRDLLQQAIRFSVGYQNAASAFRRMVQAGGEAERLLSDAQRRQGSGFFQIKLSANGLRAACEAEINRVGLVPAHASDGLSAPGAHHRNVAVNFINAPHLLPSLEAEIRRLSALLLPAPAEGQESAKAKRLPQAEIAKGHPAATSAAPAANAEETL